MDYKISFILLIFLFTKHDVKENQQSIKVGKYNAAFKDSVFIINLKSDSTFTYTKQLGKPVAYTYGKWHIEKNELILKSVPDTLQFRFSHYAGQYVFFENKRYIINSNAITEKNNPAMKYLYTELKD